MVPGASFIDGSFALVACVLRKATHSCRATDCFPPMHSVCGFGVLSLRLLHACEKIRGSPVLARFGFA